MALTRVRLNEVEGRAGLVGRNRRYVAMYDLVTTLESAKPYFKECLNTFMILQSARKPM